MFKKFAKNILMALLIVCSFTLVACGEKENDGKGGSGGGLEGKTIEKIEILTPIKDTYFVGDTLDITEAKIKVTYKNKTSEEITILAEMVSGFDTSTAGEKTIIVTYEEKTIEVPYTVTAITPTNIVLKSNFKTTYFVGDALDISGGVVTLTYNNETTKDVNLTAQHISNFSTTTAENANLTITVEGKTLEVPYTVTAVVVNSISIKTPFKTTYFVGDTLNVTGAKLTLTYNNEKTEDINITADMISGFDSTSAATINLSLTHSGKTISNIPCQIRAVELVGVALKAPFADTEYFVGEQISLAGNKLVLTYNNEKTEEIDVISSMISNFNSTSAGTKQFTINYFGHIIPVEYTVVAVVATSLELETNFKTTTYYIGANIDIRDAVIKVVYNNGDNDTLPVTIDMISNFSTTTVGQFTFLVEYRTLTLEVDYTVSEVVATNIVLSKPFNKTIYYLGQLIDVSGAEITVTYNNGHEETLAVDKSMIKSFSTSIEGESKKFKITYSGFTIQVPYIVRERQVSVYTSIKLAYAVNEELDVTGGKIEVTYTDGTATEYVDITADMISGFNSSSAGQRRLTINYDGIALYLDYTVE